MEHLYNFYLFITGVVFNIYIVWLAYTWEIGIITQILYFFGGIGLFPVHIFQCIWIWKHLGCNYRIEHSPQLYKIFFCHHAWHYQNCHWYMAWTGVAQLVGESSGNPSVAGSIPVRAHTWVTVSIFGLGTYRRQPIDASLSHWCFFSFPPIISKKQWKNAFEKH